MRGYAPAASRTPLGFCTPRALATESTGWVEVLSDWLTEHGTQRPLPGSIWPVLPQLSPPTTRETLYDVAIAAVDDSTHKRGLSDVA